MFSQKLVFLFIDRQKVEDNRHKFYSFELNISPNMTSRMNSSKRRMSIAPSNAVSSNSIVECSEDMSEIIKRIMVSNITSIFVSNVSINF